MSYIGGEGNGVSSIFWGQGDFIYDLVRLCRLEVRLHLGIAKRACSALGLHGLYDL